MTEGMSSKRAEWYEADYEPDDPRELERQRRLQIFRDMGFSHAIISNGRMAGKTILMQQVDEAHKVSASAGTHAGPDPIDIVMHQVTQMGMTIAQAADNLVKALTSVGKALKPVLDPNDYTLYPGEPETVKERALRLAQRPHSMAPRDGKNYNRRGGKKQ